MHDYVILNPQESSGVLDVHLRAIDLKDLEPNPAALNHAGEIGRAMIPDAFLPKEEDPPKHPHGDIAGADLE